MRAHRGSALAWGFESNADARAPCARQDKKKNARSTSVTRQHTKLDRSARGAAHPLRRIQVSVVPLPEPAVLPQPHGKHVAELRERERVPRPARDRAHVAEFARLAHEDRLRDAVWRTVSEPERAAEGVAPRVQLPERGHGSRVEVACQRPRRGR
jgi:hypothetical protein